MRIVDIRERSVAISRYADPAILSGGLTTSIVAVVTDVVRDGRPVVGHGFGSIGRFAQSGLIRERFAPRLLAAADGTLADAGNLDPFRAWAAMMAGEKPGGHGERCVAVGTLDMALWDAAAKIAGLPLHRFLANRLGREEPVPERVPVYAGGGYPYPADDLARLAEEMRGLADLGYTRAKIKIGAAGLAQDLRRIEVAAAALGGPGRLAVDAMNAYDGPAALAAVAALAPLGLWWFEDVCDPLDFSAQAARGGGLSGADRGRGSAVLGGRGQAAGACMAGCGPTATSCCSTRCIATACPALCRSSTPWPRRAGRAGRSGLTGAISSPSTCVAALGLGGAEVNPALLPALRRARRRRDRNRRLRWPAAMARHRLRGTRRSAPDGQGPRLAPRSPARRPTRFLRA